jgi:hypothetical protein
VIGKPEFLKFLENHRPDICTRERERSSRERSE